jgi:hypothetical protein
MSKNPTALSVYWQAYGGFKAIIKSFYFWASILITLLCYSFWSTDKDWFLIPLSGLPSLLGFALGGYGVWLSVGNPKLKKLLSLSFEKKSLHSDFLVVNATFVHFIILQVISFIYLLVLKANSIGKLLNYLKLKYPLNYTDCIATIIDSLKILAHGFGFLIFVYSIITMLAATFAIFNIAIITDEINKIEDEDLDTLLTTMLEENEKNSK